MRKHWSAFLGSPSGVAAVLSIVLILVITLLGPTLVGDRATERDMLAAYQGPSAEHWLGTDQFGRDLLARTIAAAPLSIGLAVLATGLAAAIAVPLAIVIVLGGPRVRAVGFRIVDGALAFPPILLALVATAVMGIGRTSAVVATAIAFTAPLTRLLANLGASVAGRDYVANARSTGLSSRAIAGRYILPNMAEPVIVALFSFVGISLVTISSISFLGLGVQPPEFDWGRMLIEGLDSAFSNPTAPLAAGGAILLFGLGLTYIGESLARATNPLLWTASSRRGRRGRAALPDPRDRPQRVGDRAGGPGDDQAVLVVDRLRVRIDGVDGDLVRDVSFQVGRGEVLGIVGESGCGKTLTAMAVSGLAPPRSHVTAASLTLLGHDLQDRDRRRTNGLLGRNVSVVFQNPMSSLNPVLRIGTQVSEPVRVHAGLRRTEARAVAVERLREVAIPGAAWRAAQYPHEFSGGMRQRAMIAMGLTVEPALLIADEPTTALDVTVQAQILDLLAEVRSSRQMAVVFISHDIAVVTSLCDRVLVMYAGEIVEELSGEALAAGKARHPYTRALLAAQPPADHPRTRLATIPRSGDHAALSTEGCRFADRCTLADDVCRREPPVLSALSVAHSVSCHRVVPVHLTAAARSE